MTHITFDTMIPATVSIDTDSGATKVEISILNMEIPEGALDEDGVFLLGTLVTEHQTVMIQRNMQEDRGCNCEGLSHRFGCPEWVLPL